MKRKALLFPTLQPRHTFAEEARQEARDTHFFHLLPDERLHLTRGPVGLEEFSIRITQAAVHRTARSVGIGTPTLGVFL